MTVYVLVALLAAGIKAVSYTHLDVYKRQGQLALQLAKHRARKAQMPARDAGVAGGIQVFMRALAIDNDCRAKVKAVDHLQIGMIALPILHRAHRRLGNHMEIAILRCV